MKTLIRILLVMCFAAPYAWAEDRVPYPHSMAVLGDSISEGMLSEFSIERPPTLPQLVSMAFTAVLTQPANRILEFRKKYAKAEHAWFSGESSNDFITSHLERLRQVSPDLKAYNFAISGSTTQDLAKQVTELLETERKEQRTMEYLSLLIGANDLKAKTLDEIVLPITYELNIKTALTRILEKDPYRQILMVGLPKVYRIFEESQDIVGYRLLGSDIRCDDLRRTFYGNAVFFDRSNPDYDRTKIVYHMYQEALERVAGELRIAFPMAHIRTVQNYDVMALLNKTLSVDCFHPSEWGQAMLAEVTWSYSFWPELEYKNDLFDE